MALNAARKPLFTEEWAAGLASVPESGMVGEIELFLPGGPGVWNDTTNDWVPGTDTVLYEGEARVQPIRTASDKSVSGNATTVQTILISIPRDTLDIDIRPFKHQVRVTKSPLNPSLKKFVYVVHEVMDSTNPLENTFYCKVNQETVV